MGWDPAVVPDPQDPATFTRSKLDWSELATGRHAVLLEAYRSLAQLRRTYPELTDPAFGSLTCELDESSRVLRITRGERLRFVLALGTSPVSAHAPATSIAWATPGGVATDGDTVVVPPGGAVVLATA